MINKIIEDLKKEIEELEERRKELELSDDLIHAPDILQGVYYQLNWKKAKLQAYEDAQRIICGEIKKCKIHTMGNLILIEEDELLKKFQGESNE